MADYRNAEGSTGRIEGGAFVPFADQAEADASLEPRPAGPFADLPEAARKSLAAAGVTTVEQAKALGKEGLVKLDGIGDAIAKQILAL